MNQVSHKIFCITLKVKICTQKFRCFVIFPEIDVFFSWFGTFLNNFSKTLRRILNSSNCCENCFGQFSKISGSFCNRDFVYFIINNAQVCVAKWVQHIFLGELQKSILALFQKNKILFLPHFSIKNTALNLKSRCKLCAQNRHISLFYFCRIKRNRDRNKFEYK